MCLLISASDVRFTSVCDSIMISAFHLINPHRQSKTSCYALLSDQMNRAGPHNNIVGQVDAAPISLIRPTLLLIQQANNTWARSAPWVARMAAPRAVAVSCNAARRRSRLTREESSVWLLPAALALARTAARIEPSRPCHITLIMSPPVTRLLLRHDSLS